MNNQDLSMEAGLLVNGHFVFSSGMHGDTFVNKMAFAWASRAAVVADTIAGWIVQRAPEAQVIVGPELGAVMLVADVRTALSRVTGRDIAGVYARKKPGGGFYLNRNQALLVRDKAVVVVEDTGTTGASARGAIEATTAAGGRVIGVAFFWNRGDLSEQTFGVPVGSVVEKTLPSYAADTCPLCAAGIPISSHRGRGA